MKPWEHSGALDWYPLYYRFQGSSAFKKSEYRSELVEIPAGSRRNSTFSTESYRSDGRTSSVAAEPRAGNASRHTRYLPEKTV